MRSPARVIGLRVIAAGAIALAGVASSPAQTRPAAKIDGLWNAVVVANGTEIPFRFELSTKGTAAQGFFFEGDTKVGSTSGTFSNGVLKLEYDFLNTELDATLADDELHGTYGTPASRRPPMEFRAKRFAPVPVTDTNPPDASGSWDMRRVPDEVKAPRDTRTWTLFLRQSGPEVAGSILRVDGDTGTLVGHWDGGTLVLSHFSGDRPMRLEAAFKPDHTLAITLNGRDHYFAARSGNQARAQGIPEPPDPSRYTNVKDPTAPFAFSFPDEHGKMVSNTDPAFRGKVVILSIGGSWCPNCRDEAPFLAQLYKDYHSRGLEIVALMFENSADPKVSWPRIDVFAKRYGLQYPMLLCGTTQQINEKMPQLVNFGAYPTSIYLGRDGKVRSVHAGFASPATGDEHTRLTTELRSLVERLLAEQAPSTAAGAQ